MDAQHQWDLMRTYEEKLALPDPPHGLLARSAQEASAWIISLGPEDRAFLFSYLRTILERPGTASQKAQTLWVLSRLPVPESEALLARFVQAGTALHGQADVSFAASAWEALYDETLSLQGRALRLRYRRREVSFSRPGPPGGLPKRYALFSLPQALSDGAMALYGLHEEDGAPVVLLRRRSAPDLALRLDLCTGALRSVRPLAP